MLDDALLNMIRGADTGDAEELFLRAALAAALRERGMDEQIFGRPPVAEAAGQRRRTRRADRGMRRHGRAHDRAYKGCAAPIATPRPISEQAPAGRHGTRGHNPCAPGEAGAFQRAKVRPK